jgi:hypothetical protein
MAMLFTSQIPTNTIKSALPTSFAVSIIAAPFSKLEFAGLCAVRIFVRPGTPESRRNECDPTSKKTSADFLALFSSAVLRIYLEIKICEAIGQSRSRRRPFCE